MAAFLDLLYGFLALLFVLFLPGYALSLGFYPRRGELDAVERFVLSFALSITTFPLVLVAATTFGFRLDAVTSLAAFLGVTLLGVAVWALRTQMVALPPGVQRLLGVVEKGEGVGLLPHSGER